MATAVQPHVTPDDARRRYLHWLARSGYAPSTKAAYADRVNNFLDWLEQQPGEQYKEALEDEHVRNYAVRDYRRTMMVDRAYKLATVELHLSAIGSLYKFLGLGQPDVPRQTPVHDKVKALTEDQLRAVLRAAERRGVRDFALMMLLYATALRLAEVTALNVDDVFISERKGEVTVRYGKGGKTRRIEVPPRARAALAPLLAERHRGGGDLVGAPLFLSRQGDGSRLSRRRIQSLVAEIGREAGVEGLTPHMLRHTHGRMFIERGGDIVALQKVLGHANVQTTATYARPSHEYMQQMAERIEIDL